MAERSTFSPVWHRVRLMKPRLRPHVQITRQHYRGRRWHVVHDPSSNHFYRLNAIAHEFVALLDGDRTVEEVWHLTLQRRGDESLTQNDVIQVLSQLYQANLLGGDVQPETEQLLRRGRERRAKTAAQQAIGLMYFRLKLFNPDPIFSWIEPILRPVLSLPGLIAWAVLVIAALASLAPHWERLASGLEGAIAPANWGWMILIFVLLKAIHETGHGVICKRFGGQVPEFGAMLLVLLPAPYVDASAAWAFENKWRRIAVGAGGMIFELAVAAVAAFVWLATDAGLLNQLAYNAMLSAGIATVLFNANPLMKFDGYYILSDLLEVPNLMQRSNKMLHFLFQRHAYRLREAQPPTTALGEAVILLVYGILALAYRILLFVTITLYVMGMLFAVGLFLAIWTAAMWFILPVGKFIHWLAASPQTADARARCWVVSGVMVAVVLLAVGAIPFADHRRATGVVEADGEAGLFFAAAGFVTEVHARPGQAVRAGDPVLTTQSPELDAQIALLEARLLEAESRERQATGINEGVAQIARQYIALTKEQIASARDKHRRLIVRAPIDGILVGPDPAGLLGAYVQEGQPAAALLSPDQTRIVATLDQGQGAWLEELPRDGYTVAIRLASDVRVSRPGRTLEVAPAARRELPHPALAADAGGQIATDPQDRTGLQAQRPVFRATIALSDDLPWRGLPGERASLRFTLPDKPLLSQWLDRLQKTLQGRAQL